MRSRGQEYEQFIANRLDRTRDITSSSRHSREGPFEFECERGFWQKPQLGWTDRQMYFVSWLLDEQGTNQKEWARDTMRDFETCKRQGSHSSQSMITSFRPFSIYLVKKFIVFQEIVGIHTFCKYGILLLLMT